MKKISEAPLCKKFSELYDLKSVKPGGQYLEQYKRIREELSELGFDYSKL
ncbi:monomethylamine:corrinoid methyltransferase [bacterium]|nr:monomethylamine:corrinoid methyltransferase [bacterium]